MIQRVYRGDDQAIIHVHGHWNDPLSVVFGTSSYADVLGDQHSAEFLRMMVWGKTAVFCGFGAGLRDPNFTALRNWLRSYPGSEYAHYRLVRSGEVTTAEGEHHADEHITVVPFGANHQDLPTFLDAILAKGPFRGDDSTHAPRRQRRATPPAREILPTSQPARDELSQIAARLTEAKDIAADTSNPLIGSSGEVIDPAVRDVYIRFQNLFADEADIVTGATFNSELTQTQADEAVGLGRRLITLLDSPPPH